VLTCQISATAGIPIAIHPEDAQSSALGAAHIVRERTDFIRKYNHKSKNVFYGFNVKETKILRSMLEAQSDARSRMEAHTVKFGICSVRDTEIRRCLTFMNLGEESITLSVFSHSEYVKW
jgi:hypothetical protein